MPEPFEIHVGDIVRLRKQHPCGGWEWRVVRTGADIGIVCQTCRRRLTMPRHKFRRSVKSIERRSEAPLPDNDTPAPTSDGALSALPPDSSAPA